MMSIRTIVSLTIALVALWGSSQAQIIAPQGQTVVSGNGIEYHGGPVMINPHNIYLVWYGDWNGNSATTILPDFFSSLDHSPYFYTNTTYSDGNGNVILPTVTLGAQFFDFYSQGSTLNNQSLINIVSSAIVDGDLPLDANGIYFVLTSADVAEIQSGSAFCTQACGFHNRTTIFSTDIKFAFVGNPDQCPSSCFERSPSPNGNSGADAMALTIAHELNETVTDPDLNAWFHFNLGGEVGDLCHPNNVPFLETFATSNGALANVFLGDRAYLIQSNFVNLPSPQGGCQMRLSILPPGWVGVYQTLIAAF